MSTGFRQIYLSGKLQAYWGRRLAAIIIDSLIISFATWFIIAILMMVYLMSVNASFYMPWWSMHGLVFPFVSGIPLFLYSAFTEYTLGHTMGKMVMGLKVVTAEGNKPRIDTALLRNATKIYGLALLLDVVIPLALPGDPMKKYTDKVSGTAVVSVEH